MTTVMVHPGDDHLPQIAGQRHPAEFAGVGSGVAEFADPAAGPLGGQPQTVIDGGADRAMELVCRGDHRRCNPAECDLRDGDRVIGLAADESVLGGGVDGEVNRGAGLVHLAGHPGKSVLDGLKIADRSAELLAPASVRDAVFDRRIQRTDHLNAPGPRAAPGQFRGGVGADGNGSGQIRDHGVAGFSTGVVTAGYRHLIRRADGDPQVVSIVDRKHDGGGVRGVGDRLERASR